ncbi:hypothetical protein GCM10009851_20100 [Herbiconiux moechotypicola]|uniref:HTH gntR-type domain-containing protein n=1 Tax=Herbiconiux moechotypicola TaxID=637393 RepID=A0ABP5QGC1_9MICO
MSDKVSLDDRLRDVWRRAAEEGTSMPGESTLALDLEMSRPAVREALVRLEERGYIRRRKGADTVVNTSLLNIPARFDRQVDKLELIRSTGRDPGVEVLSHEITPITVDEAVEFEVAPGTPVLRLTKLWTADGRPVMLARDCVPLAGRRAVGYDPSESIFSLALSLGHEHIEWEVVWPGADVLSEADARALGRPEGEAVLTVELTGVGRSGRTGYWSSELHVKGALRYAMVRSVKVDRGER